MSIRALAFYCPLNTLALSLFSEKSYMFHNNMYSLKFTMYVSSLAFSPELQRNYYADNNRHCMDSYYRNVHN